MKETLLSRNLMTYKRRDMREGILRLKEFLCQIQNRYTSPNGENVDLKRKAELRVAIGEGYLNNVAFPIDATRRERRPEVRCVCLSG